MFIHPSESGMAKFIVIYSLTLVWSRPGQFRLIPQKLVLFYVLESDLTTSTDTFLLQEICIFYEYYATKSYFPSK